MNEPTSTDPGRDPRRDPAWRRLSARSIVTLGICGTVLLAAGLVLGVAYQILTVSTEREFHTRLDTELDQFEQFIAKGTLPGAGLPLPVPANSMRFYLADHANDPDEFMVATAPVGRIQFVSSQFREDQDPHFGPEIRAELKQIAMSADGPPTGELEDADILWHKRVVDTRFGKGVVLAAISRADGQAETNRTMRELLVAPVVALLVTGLVAWLLASRMLAPLERFRRAADRVSGKDLAHRVPEDGPAEITSLARSFNEMLDRLEASDRTQREFLDDAGHELRTPLTVVQGHLDLMPVHDDEESGSRRLMQDELTRMSRIVEDLLTLARSDRPDFLRLSPTDICELSLDVEAKAEVMADREWIVRTTCGQSCHREDDEDDAEGTALYLLDRERITQALLQYAANAVRYTEPGDLIEIGCAVVSDDSPAGPPGTPPPPPLGPGDHALWWVRDHGSGVPPGEEAAIFERFATARGQLRDGRGGTGLGLAIVATIARAHGGISYAYNADGGGACFSLVVPLHSMGSS